MLGLWTSNFCSAYSSGYSPSTTRIRNDFTTSGCTLIQDTYGYNSTKEMLFAIGK